MGGGAGTPDLLQRIEAGREGLAARIRGALDEYAFSNYAIILPRRLGEIAREEAEAFLAFLSSGDAEAARQRGRRLAQEGLGPRSVLALTETIRQVGWESANPEVELWPPLQEAIGRYTTALLEGYMAGREESILEQQEKTRQALLRALQRSQG
jgi:hypothetical protein